MPFLHRRAVSYAFDCDVQLVALSCSSGARTAGGPPKNRLAPVPALEPAPMSGAASDAPKPAKPAELAAPAAVAAAAVAPTTNPSLAPCDAGDAHVLGASSLPSTLPLPQLHQALAFEVSNLTHLVHAQPDSTVAWHLLVLQQHAAAAPGLQCRLYCQRWPTAGWRWARCMQSSSRRPHPPTLALPGPWAG